MSKKIAVIFGGGTGRRVSNIDIPKQFIEIGGKPIIAHTLQYFQDHSEIDAIYISCVDGWQDHLQKIVRNNNFSKVKKIVTGGNTSQKSIFNALLAASSDYESDTLVLIHDAVRPIISEALITNVIEDAQQFGNAVTCTMANETPVISEDGKSIIDMPKRSNMYVAQAPQAFHLGKITDAHIKEQKTNPEYTDVVDSATLMMNFGERIHMVISEYGNIKITYPEDVEYLRGYLVREQ